MPDLETRVFRDVFRHSLRVRRSASDHLSLIVTDASNTTATFTPQPADVASIVTHMLAAVGEWLVDEVDAEATDSHAIGGGRTVGYYQELCEAYLDSENFGRMRFLPGDAIEAGTWLIAFGRRAQREAAISRDAEVSDMANDMADMPWAPMDEPGRRELAAAMVRAGYGRRPTDG